MLFGDVVDVGDEEDDLKQIIGIALEFHWFLHVHKHLLQLDDHWVDVFSTVFLLVAGLDSVDVPDQTKDNFNWLGAPDTQLGGNVVDINYELQDLIEIVCQDFQVLFLGNFEILNNVLQLNPRLDEQFFNLLRLFFP